MLLPDRESLSFYIRSSNFIIDQVDPNDSIIIFIISL